MTSWIMLSVELPGGVVDVDMSTCGRFQLSYDYEKTSRANDH